MDQSCLLEGMVYGCSTAKVSVIAEKTWFNIQA